MKCMPEVERKLLQALKLNVQYPEAFVHPEQLASPLSLSLCLSLLTGCFWPAAVWLTAHWVKTHTGESGWGGYTGGGVWKVLNKVM